MKSQVRNFMLALIILVSMSAFANVKTPEDFVVCTGWHALLLELVIAPVSMVGSCRAFR